jgi:CheY-like chemotaxis protein
MKIAILEDNADRRAVMQSCLADRFHQYELHFFDEVSEMIDFLEESLPETIVIALDHDLELKPGPSGKPIDPGTGRDVADYLARKAPACPIIIHTTNVSAARGMEKVLHDANWETHRVVPFDDLSWIAGDWFRTIRRAIIGTARPAKRGNL